MTDRPIKSTLADRQEEFLAQILDEECALPIGWTARHATGVTVYRNAYRSRLVDALHSTFERTARWVGEDAFRQAAAHHIISHPPTSWTLDDIGNGFVETLHELFGKDPEVPELAWLEWAMHRCFVSADMRPLNANGFSEATAEFAEEDWANMRLTFLPGTYQQQTSYDMSKLWQALKEEPKEGPASVSEHSLNNQIHTVVWREGMKPVFMHVDAVEGQALQLLMDGASYGEVCETLSGLLGEEEAVNKAGSMLGIWLHRGLIASVSR